MIKDRNSRAPIIKCYYCTKVANAQRRPACRDADLRERESLTETVTIVTHVTFA